MKFYSLNHSNTLKCFKSSYFSNTVLIMIIPHLSQILQSGKKFKYSKTSDGTEKKL